MSNFITHPVEKINQEEVVERSKKFYAWIKKRRTLRNFSKENIPIEVMENIILSAGTAPSGAHKQPWTFCLVSNPEMKKLIRLAAEEEEKTNYGGRMSEQWLKDLEPFETNENKPFLEDAPYLIVVFKKMYELNKDGERMPNYYVNESVGIATGFLLAAIHNAGLVALTHTPSPMNFLARTLKRPDNERAFLLIPVGYPPENPKVPDLQRKALNQVMIHYG